MTMASSEPWADDYGHLTAEEEAAEHYGSDPFCTWCGDAAERWVIQEGRAVMAPCPNCTEGETNA